LGRFDNAFWRWTCPAIAALIVVKGRISKKQCRMETIIILLIFGGVPLTIFALIIAGAILRAWRERKIEKAADKIIES
jgi:uncharacterized SAM-binding protein YcdF (DUF218 family)